MTSKSNHEQIHLSLEQNAAYRDVLAGRNVLVTGPAGSGKSVLLRKLRDDNREGLFVTASTGIAALNVGGSTLHSFAGLGRGESDPEGTARTVATSRAYLRVRENILACKVLAIDEISMVSGELLSLLDLVLRKVRGSRSADDGKAPFGGIRIVAFGDFLQLPPVATDGRPATFAFESLAWAKGDFRVHVLTQVFRQRDPQLAKAFGALRIGDLRNPAVNLLAPRNNLAVPNDGISATVIHTRNVDVDSLNLAALARIDGRTRFYEAEDTGSVEDVKRLDRDCLCPRRLLLKKGATVMLLANLNVEEGLVNGSMGQVLDLAEGNVTVRFGKQVVDIKPRAFNLSRGNEEVATRTQLPLRLAYALTAHKAQGMTLDRICCHLHPRDVFEAGMAYVAVSRVRSLEGLFLQKSARESFRPHPKAMAFYGYTMAAPALPQLNRHHLAAA